MKFVKMTPVEHDVKTLIIDVKPRHWEDAEVNDLPETDDAPKMPFKEGNDWRLKIDLETGRIEGWPKGMTARTHYKVCDAGIYHLIDETGAIVSTEHGYVPAMLGGGDYLKISIGSDGVIENWEPDLSYFKEAAA